MKYFFAVILFLFSLSSFAQESNPQTTLEQIIKHTEKASLYRNNVDWTVLKKKMHDLAKETTSDSELKPALDLMFKTLKDDHGRVIHNRAFLSYYLGEEKPHVQNLDSKVYNDIQSGRVYSFKTELLHNDIGYVRIVGLPMGDNNKMTSEIQTAVCELEEKGASTWIIDLRYNGGGNMFPMVEGIAPIIGDGIVGGTKGITEKENSIWKIENGDFYYDEQNVAFPNDCSASGNQKIAVLVSEYTASSGEALAVILKNRPNTRFFGNKTNGKVTVTDWNQLNELTALMISVSYYMDREGNTYDQFVDVDEELLFNPGEELSTDEGITSAIRWINE